MLLDNRRPIAVPVDETSLTLWRAAGYMEKYGWCRDAGKDSMGRVCLLGAIRAVSGRYGDMLRSARRLRRLIGHMNITDYNDLYLASYAEAVSVLRQAAAL
jgi:hypothetical protein